MESKAEQKRKLILNAATQFILDHEFHALTLEAVAKQAGISKGGLLYHFPSKDALLKGLAAFIFDEFTSNFKEQALKDPVERGRWSRAFIEVSKWDLDQNAKLNVGLAATSLLDQEVSGRISESYQYVQNKLEQDGLEPVTTTIIRLAMDGLYYSELFQLATLDEDLKNDVIQKLINMTRGVK